MTCYCPDQALANRARACLEACAADLGLEGLKQLNLEALDQDKDWVSISQQGLPIVQAGAWQIYGSHDRPKARAARYALNIDANTAFGTGHHETTFGAMLAYQRLNKKQCFENLLDLGCGSGILALLALKAQSRKPRVLGTDIDAQAVERAKLNAKANACGYQNSGATRWVTAAGTRHLAVLSAAPYDLIFANILAGPLYDLAPDIASISTQGTVVILAGFILKQEQQLLARYRSFGFIKEGRSQKGDWPVLTLRKKG